jgi:hypothetical protein
MSLLNGNLGWVILRDKKRIRDLVGTLYTARLRSLYADFLEGRWSPSKTDAIGPAVSLTSWRPRLPYLPLVILSLLCQTTRPSTIYVWLASEDYALLDPSVLEMFSLHGVCFEKCDDLGPHKKWLPMIESGKSDPFIICDDDILYPRDWLKHLIQEDREDAYVGVRCHRILRDENGDPLPYAKWDRNIPWLPQPSHDLFITGCGGAIIHPLRIRNEFRDRDTMLAKCPWNDDIWLKVAHAAAGFPCYKTRFSFPFLEIPGTRTSRLMQANVLEGGNDRHLASVKEWLTENVST